MSTNIIQRVREWLTPGRRAWIAFALLGAAVLCIAALGYRAVRRLQLVDPSRDQAFITWGTGDEEDRLALMTIRNAEPCPGAPFILPADGFIGLMYAAPRSPYSPSRPHQGIDIFSLGGPGLTPVYAAYDGYVTREPHWTSSLIIRVPQDPLDPTRQIWLYYTHMADRTGEQVYISDEFPPGTVDKFVERGTLLGYTGNYNGNSARGVWVHLHFSIIRDDGNGNYSNELDFNNSIDPSRYLGIPVNIACAPVVPTCSAEPLCEEAVLSASGG
ncbi:MAG: M23 family metallopeptidase [Chloroflexi bacterium]|nr:M23 family metallopeptidase [Chloroflexota bacterium]